MHILSFDKPIFPSSKAVSEHGFEVILPFLSQLPKLTYQHSFTLGLKTDQNLTIQESEIRF